MRGERACDREARSGGASKEEGLGEGRIDGVV